jgi:hypothetical protein
MTGKYLLNKARENRVRALEYVRGLSRSNGYDRRGNVAVFSRSKSIFWNEDALFQTYDEMKLAA